MKIRSVLFAAALCCVVAGCTSPPAPTPRPGQAAQLDPSAVAYDNITFRGSRADPVPKDGECAVLSPANLEKAGVRAERKASGLPGYGCSVDLEDGDNLLVKTAATEFHRYWISTTADAISGFEHFSRQIVDSRYYAVEYIPRLTYGRPCTIAVDFGAPDTFTVSLAPSNKRLARGTQETPVEVPIDEALQRCDRLRDITAKFVAAVDPGGGSVPG